MRIVIAVQLENLARNCGAPENKLKFVQIMDKQMTQGTYKKETQGAGITPQHHLRMDGRCF